MAFIPKLQTLSNDTVRQNFDLYDNSTPDMIKILFDDWKLKFQHNELTTTYDRWRNATKPLQDRLITKHRSCIYNIIVTGKKNRILVNKYDPFKALLDYCYNLGLQYNIEYKKRKRIINISKPDNWKWEYTEHRQIDNKTLVRQGKLNSKQYDLILTKMALENLCCRYCDVKGSDKPLYNIRKLVIFASKLYLSQYNTKMCYYCGFQLAKLQIEKDTIKYKTVTTCCKCGVSGFYEIIHRFNSQSRRKNENNCDRSYCNSCLQDQQEKPRKYGPKPRIIIIAYEQYHENDRFIDEMNILDDFKNHDNISPNKYLKPIKIDHDCYGHSF
jgi:hypothetical protein